MRFRLVMSSIADSKVYKFLEALKGAFRPGFFSSLKSFVHAGSLASDVRHLLRERQFGPAAVFQGSVLHGY